MVAQHKLKRILEIGTLHGVATSYFAATGAEVTTVYLPESAFNLPSVDDSLAACELSAEIVRKPSREAMAEWIAAGGQFDLVYVDGSHSQGDALTDLLLADRLLVYERQDQPNWGVGRKECL
jgi:predicted O-methyltransferase YrrM